jgi:alkylation response protein AidB-like acyl-CoA dehydrogenase
MDLELTDEQGWLAESVAELLSRHSDDAAWSALIDFGLPAIASGDEGLGAVELALIGRAIGERLESVPFVDTAATRYSARMLAGSEPCALTAAPDADAAITLCLLEPGGGWDLERPATRLRDPGTGALLLTGEKAAVHKPGSAAAFLVLAADGDERRLVLAAPDIAGVGVARARAFDDSLEPSTITFADVELPAANALPADLSELMLTRLQAIGGVLAASEAVGAAATLVRLASEYAGERRQFGRPIASFQALRHLLADMYVKQASAWSSVLFAAAALEDEIADARLTASIAKAYASRATLAVAHGAIQVLGGTGFTAEHPAHLYLRRILARGAQFGDARHHERAIGRALAAPAPVEEFVG